MVIAVQKTYYEKIVSKSGRVTYKPVEDPFREYTFETFPEGTHLVMCGPGSRSCRFNVNPDYAAIIAAGRVANEAMVSAIVKASEIERHTRLKHPLTEEQRQAWEYLLEVLGESARYLQYPSAHDVAQQGVDAMIAEANKLLTNPTVRKAYDNFQLCCDLTRTTA